MTSPSLQISDLVQRYGCVEHAPHADVSLHLDALAPLHLADATHLAFLANEKYFDEALKTNAGALLCTQAMAQSLSEKGCKARLFICAEPYVTFARVSQFFFKPRHPFEGHSTQAVIDISAQVHPQATVFPFAFIGPGARVGARSVIYSGVFIGAASEVGEDCIVYPNAVVREGCRVGNRCIINPGAVIGGDGFGFAPSGMENVKIPQVGGVVLQDDVEIGSNSSVDRGAMSDTRIGTQTKIDSLVQVAHNVEIGKACFIAAQTGIGGSTKIGNRVTLAGQVGVIGHISIADYVTVLAKSGVTKDLKEKDIYNGIPSRPNRDFLMQLATLNRLVVSKKRKREKNEN